MARPDRGVRSRLHDDDDDSLFCSESFLKEKESTTSTQGEPKKTPSHVVELFKRGMSAAREFADLHPVAAVYDFDRLISANWEIWRIVQLWRIEPPYPGLLRSLGQTKKSATLIYSIPEEWPDDEQKPAGAVVEDAEIVAKYRDLSAQYGDLFRLGSDDSDLDEEDEDAA